MAKENLKKFNDKLENGFRLSRFMYAMRGEKWAELVIPYRKQGESDIVLIVYIYFNYQKIPSLSVREYRHEKDLYASIGEAKYKTLGDAQKRRNYNLLASYTHDWDKEKIIAFWELFGRVRSE